MARGGLDAGGGEVGIEAVGKAADRGAGTAIR